MQDLKKFKEQIITQFDRISKKYEDTYCDSRSRGCLYQDLFNLYKNSIEPILGDELGKKVFKKSLIQYCGFAYGLTMFENLFHIDA